MLLRSSAVYQHNLAFEFYIFASLIYCLSVFFLFKMYGDLEYLVSLFGIVLCAYAARKIKRRCANQRLQRRFKVRPINRARKSHGNYNYYTKMKKLDSEEFFRFTRMTVSVFEKLLKKVKPKIRRQYRSDGITPEERLIITLQYLSQGSSMQALAWTFHVGLTTVHKIIHETCLALWNSLSSEYLKTPECNEEWLDISQGFNEKWNVPHCLGSIDGKHIKIQATARSGSLYFNYKKTFSIVLLASCDYKYKFTCVDIGAYGSQSDGGIFRNSVFGQRFEESGLNIPTNEQLPGINISMPYFFVADETFPLKQFIMRPYPGKKLSDKQKIFNYRLSRARQVIENTFGILIARWRVLKTTITAKVDNIDNIVKAVAVLHNYCQTELADPQGNNIYCPQGYVDTDGEENGAWRTEEDPLESIGRVGANVSKRYVYSIRDVLSDYFTSDQGRVSWQDRIFNL